MLHSSIDIIYIIIYLLFIVLVQVVLYCIVMYLETIELFFES